MYWHPEDEYFKSIGKEPTSLQMRQRVHLSKTWTRPHVSSSRAPKKGFLGMFRGRMFGKEKKSHWNQQPSGATFHGTDSGVTGAMGVPASITGGTVLDNLFINRIVWV